MLIFIPIFEFYNVARATYYIATEKKKQETEHQNKLTIWINEPEIQLEKRVSISRIRMKGEQSVTKSPVHLLEEDPLLKRCAPEDASITLPPKIVRNDLEDELHKSFDLRGEFPIVLRDHNHRCREIRGRRGDESTTEAIPHVYCVKAAKEKLLMRFPATGTQNTIFWN